MSKDYEQSQTIDAPPEEVFAWLADVDNLPSYLPPVAVPPLRDRLRRESPAEG